MLKDPEKVVQQGVGIFLRELWALHSEEVEEFLLNNKDNIAPTVIQYATEKMQRTKKKQFGRAAMVRPPQSVNQPRKQSQPTPNVRIPISVRALQQAQLTSSRRWKDQTHPRQRDDSSSQEKQQ
jgi:hypothetical protein